MATRLARTEDRYPDRDLPELPEYVTDDFHARAQYSAACYIDAVRASLYRDFLGSGSAGPGGLLEPSLARWLPAAIYISIGLAACLLWNINFVYIFLTTTNIILFSAQIVTYWQLPHTPWLAWFILTNAGKAIGFFLAGMLVLNPESAAMWRLPLRIAWLIVFVLIAVGTWDMVYRLIRSLHVKKRIYERNSDEQS